MKQAVIFGATGQDGSYLSELLLGKGYRVVGVARRSSVNTTERLINILHHDNFSITQGDVTDYPSVSGILSQIEPDECYNLAAQSHVGTSFTQPSYTFDVCATGVLNILESIRNVSPHTHFYQASTSELFGNSWSCRLEDNAEDKYQNEYTPFTPTSPYAIAKLAAHHLVGMYRKAYSLHASAGILFNHESERRGENFVTRKITKWIGDFMAWLPDGNDGDKFTFEFTTDNLDYDGAAKRFPKLRLGNLDAKRDWGHAEDYVEMMWRMVNADTPDDYVIATGETHSIREFLDTAFSYVGIDDWSNFVVVDPKFCRPSDIEHLRGISLKAKDKLDWEPKIDFQELVERMVRFDIGAAIACKL